jgi:hypothetical protein
MSSTQTSRQLRAENLAAQLHRWVRDGLLTAEQARRILAHEEKSRPVQERGEATRPHRRLVVEALAYIGGVVALAAGLLLVQLVWSDLSAGGRLAVPLSAAAALLLAGKLVPGDAPERLRLRSAVWALGTAAWAVALAVLGDQVLEIDPSDTLLLTGLAASLLSLRLYLVCRDALQQLSLQVTASLTALAVADRAGWDEPTLLGLGVWAVAAAWFALGEHGVLTPAGPVRYGAAVGLVVGALMTQGSLGGQLVAAGTVGFSWSAACSPTGSVSSSSPPSRRCSWFPRPCSTSSRTAGGWPSPSRCSGSVPCSSRRPWPSRGGGQADRAGADAVGHAVRRDVGPGPRRRRRRHSSSAPQTTTGKGAMSSTVPSGNGAVAMTSFARGR